MPTTEWKADSWGHERCALYLGALYVGHIQRGAHNHFGKWRGWFMSDEDGADTGWFDTDDEARKSVENLLRAAIT